MKTIVHVTEAMGGGVATALESYVMASPQYRHILICAPRVGHDTGQRLTDTFERVVRTGQGPRGLNRDLAPVLRQLRPDLVHLHSSWAGVLGRVRRAGAPVVYSPHCFYFERTDIPGPARTAALRVERLLASRTAVAACVSPNEALLARRLGIKNAVFVPNTVELPHLPKPSGAREVVRVTTVGRLMAQKDPAFFAQVVAEIHRDLTLPAMEFVWIGDGPVKLRSLLAEAGVQVTGWLPRNEVLLRLLDSDLYLHTAAWEGSPMTLLEAHALHLPIVARSIPALSSLGFASSLVTPRLVAERVIQMVNDRTSSTVPTRLYDSEHDRAAQGRALEQVYSLALDVG